MCTITLDGYFFLSAFFRFFWIDWLIRWNFRFVSISFRIIFQFYFESKFESKFIWSFQIETVYKVSLNTIVSFYRWNAITLRSFKYNSDACFLFLQKYPKIFVSMIKPMSIMITYTSHCLKFTTVDHCSRIFDGELGKFVLCHCPFANWIFILLANKFKVFQLSQYTKSLPK